jgi:hypothetical protein
MEKSCENCGRIGRNQPACTYCEEKSSWVPKKVPVKRQYIPSAPRSIDYETDARGMCFSDADPGL